MGRERERETVKKRLGTRQDRSSDDLEISRLIGVQSAYFI